MRVDRLLAPPTIVDELLYKRGDASTSRQLRLCRAVAGRRRHRVWRATPGGRWRVSRHVHVARRRRISRRRVLTVGRHVAWWRWAVRHHHRRPARSRHTRRPGRVRMRVARRRVAAVRWRSTHHVRRRRHHPIGPAGCRVRRRMRHVTRRHTGHSGAARRTRRRRPCRARGSLLRARRLAGGRAADGFAGGALARLLAARRALGRRRPRWAASTRGRVGSRLRSWPHRL